MALNNQSTTVLSWQSLATRREREREKGGWECWKNGKGKLIIIHVCLCSSVEITRQKTPYHHNKVSRLLTVQLQGSRLSTSCMHPRPKTLMYYVDNVSFCWSHYSVNRILSYIQSRGQLSLLTPSYSFSSATYIRHIFSTSPTRTEYFILFLFYLPLLLLLFIFRGGGGGGEGGGIAQSVVCWTRFLA